jgi:hypothetical protein
VIATWAMTAGAHGPSGQRAEHEVEFAIQQPRKRQFVTPTTISTTSRGNRCLQLGHGAGHQRGAEEWPRPHAQADPDRPDRKRLHLDVREVHSVSMRRACGSSVLPNVVSAIPRGRRSKQRHAEVGFQLCGCSW